MTRAAMLSGTAWRGSAPLRVPGALLVLAALAGVLSSIGAGWPRALLDDPAPATGAVTGALAAGLTLVYAAGDRRRAALLRFAAAGLAATAVVALVVLASADDAPDGESLAAAAAAGLLAAVLYALSLQAPEAARRPPQPAAQEPIREEVLATAVLRGLGAILLAVAAFTVILAAVDGADAIARRPALAAASAGGAVCLGLLSLWIAAAVRDRLTLVAVPVVCAAAAALLQTGQGVREGFDVAVGAGLAVAVLLGAALFALYNRAWNARYGLRFLWPISHRALIAAADVLLDPARRKATPEEVAASVESFLVDFKARRRGLYRWALAALQVSTVVGLLPRPRVNPPLLELDPAQRRRFLEEHFQRVPQQRAWRLVRTVRQVVIRVAQQLVYAGYYSNEATYESIGYAPFTRRDRFKDLDVPEPGEHPLEVELPGEVDPGELAADICIVGTGAAGSILAYELAKQGHEVLMLERGDYVQPREFSENEIEMISRLYSDGLMQQTEDFRFTILQGSCVGGSTTVNNAVCFPPPEPVLARWNGPAHCDGALDLDRLSDSVEAVDAFLSVVPQRDAVLNRGAARVLDGARQLGLSGTTLELDVVRANVRNCFGSGYCNMGCRWGRKLSMLDVTLPQAQRDFPGKVRIVAECEVVEILTRDGDPVEVSGLVAKLGGRRQVTVRARKGYVLAAGALASSHLLLRSRVGRRLPVGKGFSANMGAPLVGDFPEPQQSYDGLQISHYGRPVQDSYVFETWFNPPVAQALNMPGWFERHFENMLRYDHLVAGGVLVGTASNGTIRAGRDGPSVRFRPTAEDLATLARGMRQLGEILFAGGAERVMVNTWGADEYTSPDQLADLDRVCSDPDYIALGTGHPQGGNALGRDAARGVVGPDFRVHGHSNLFVCDASVFPTSLTVNPQLTVMALAHYAAESIGNGAAA